MFNKVAETRYGQLIYNINDSYVGRSIELYGEYSQGEIELFDMILQPGHTVIELGANIGAHTLFFAKKVGSEGLVHAFEPQRIVYQTLCGNMAINSLTNVRTHLAGAGSEAGHAFIPPLDYAVENNFAGLGLGAVDFGEQVPVVTVDSLNIKNCQFMKIDVEGMELEVLRGSVDTIERTQPILYVECDRPDKQEALLSFIQSLGYDRYWHIPPLFNPENYRGSAENVFGNICSHNVLCVHQSAPVKINGFTKIEDVQA